MTRADCSKMTITQLEDLMHSTRILLRHVNDKIAKVEDSGYTVLSRNGCDLMTALKIETLQHLEILHTEIDTRREQLNEQRKNRNTVTGNNVITIHG